MSITLVGREGELRSIEAFLERVEVGPTGLVFSGEPGIGKTILWEAAVEQCRRNSRVLSCRCLETEASLSFGGLSDLVGSVFEEVAPALPMPRRHALEVALLLSEPGDQPLNPRAIGLGLLDVVRALADRAPLVIAVDDLQWLDSSTSRVLQIALRRLSEERAGFLATVREARDLRARALVAGRSAEPTFASSLEPGRAPSSATRAARARADQTGARSSRRCDRG